MENRLVTCPVLIAVVLVVSVFEAARGVYPGGHGYWPS